MMQSAAAAIAFPPSQANLTAFGPHPAVDRYSPKRRGSMWRVSFWPRWRRPRSPGNTT